MTPSNDNILAAIQNTSSNLVVGVQLPAIIEAAGFEPSSVCFHTFRATGVATYLMNDELIETAQAIAGHESARTTGLYDRREDEVTLTEIERIRI